MAKIDQTGAKTDNKSGANSRAMTSKKSAFVYRGIVIHRFNKRDQRSIEIGKAMRDAALKTHVVAG